MQAIRPGKDEWTGPPFRQNGGPDWLLRIPDRSTPNHRSGAESLWPRSFPAARQMMIVAFWFQVAGHTRSWLTLKRLLILSSFVLLVLVPVAIFAGSSRDPLPSSSPPSSSPHGMPSSLAIEEQVRALLETPPPSQRNSAWFPPPDVPQSESGHWAAREFPGAPYYLIPLRSPSADFPKPSTGVQ